EPERSPAEAARWEGRRWVDSYQDETEGMARGIEVDAKRFAWLVLGLAGSQSQDRLFTRIQVMDVEVEMLLLRMLASGPHWGPIVLDLLEGDGGALIGDQLHPMGVVVWGYFPAGDGRIEASQAFGVVGVDGCH